MDGLLLGSVVGIAPIGGTCITLASGTGCVVVLNTFLGFECDQLHGGVMTACLALGLLALQACLLCFELSGCLAVGVGVALAGVSEHDGELLGG